jgi:serine/threonine protein kinase/osmotically-inducible protein OsmY
VRPGDTLNHGAYRIERELGAGGFGAVYLADEIALRRKVAIKTILPEVVAREPRAAEVFYAEARLTARLAHPYILPIYFVGEEVTGGQSLPYIVMEYVDGGDLETILAKKSVDLRRRLRWMQQIAEGLGYAHEQGVLHRDLKPRNVFVTQHQTPKIGDFGLAKALGGETQTVLKGLGTPAYISPEQIQGHASDARADLYALGVMYYQMLTGRLPYDAPDVSDLAAKIMAIGYQHVHGPIPMAHAVNPEVPPDLDGLIQRLMAKTPEARPASAAEVAQAIESLLQSGPRTLIPLSPPTIAGSQTVVDSPQRSIAATQAAMGSTRAAIAATQEAPGSSRAAIAPTQAVGTSTRGLGAKWLALLAALLILGVGAFLFWSQMAVEVAAPPRSPIAQPSPPTQDAPKSAGGLPAELARTKPAEGQRQIQAQEEAARKRKEEEGARQKAEEARLAKLREEQRQQQEAKRTEEERQARTQGETIAWLENAFRTAGFKDLTVAVSPDRIVTLTGAVQDQRQRDEAIRLANLGPGVKDVRSNLTVAPAAAAPANPEAIRREVEQRFRDNGLKDLTVAVSPERVVTLSGTVPDKRQGDEAIRLVRLVPDVREVRPNITVVPPPPAPEEVQSLVEQRLRDNGLNLKVEVAPDRSVRLIGAVDSAEKKDQAMKLASGVAGVTRVRDGIFVVPLSSGPMKIQKTQ